MLRASRRGRRKKPKASDHLQEAKTPRSAQRRRGRRATSNFYILRYITFSYVTLQRLSFLC